MSSTDPIKNPGVNPGAHEVCFVSSFKSFLDFYLFINIRCKQVGNGCRGELIDFCEWCKDNNLNFYK